eukprot:TRINITY_DN3466_c0_g1_i2.p1 TRINITY_DN3466_c0_g1~~TRINITY_DN3466_c0_g1_i2.p1  ORF type:complete len:253 (+),score=52.88 TRINITY_DN3466_c0_g1_i2:65-823(+)
MAFYQWEVDQLVIEPECDNEQDDPKMIRNCYVCAKEMFKSAEETRMDKNGCLCSDCDSDPDDKDVEASDAIDNAKAKIQDMGIDLKTIFDYWRASADMVTSSDESEPGQLTDAQILASIADPSQGMNGMICGKRARDSAATGSISNVVGTISLLATDTPAVTAALAFDSLDISSWVATMDVNKLAQLDKAVDKYSNTGASDTAIKAFAEFLPVLQSLQAEVDRATLSKTYVLANFKRRTQTSSLMIRGQRNQ